MVKLAISIAEYLIQVMTRYLIIRKTDLQFFVCVKNASNMLFQSVSSMLKAKAKRV